MLNIDGVAAPSIKGGMPFAREIARLVSVDVRMAPRAKCDQVVFCVVAGLTAEPPVVNLQIHGGSASLTEPAVPLENLLA
jgi:hypothetical protein